MVSDPDGQPRGPHSGSGLGGPPEESRPDEVVEEADDVSGSHEIPIGVPVTQEEFRRLKEDASSAENDERGEERGAQLDEE